MFSKITNWKLQIGNFKIAIILLLFCFEGLAQAANIKVVPSAAMVGYDETLAVDIVVEEIPADGLGTVQFRLNVSAPNSTITGVSDLSLGSAGRISLVTPLAVGLATATRSGIGDFFWNAKSSNGILVMDNETLQNGSALYSFSHTNGAALPAGSGTIARFLIKAATGVAADHITFTLSDVALLNGDQLYSLDAATGANVQLRCKVKMPSLLGLSYTDAISVLTSAQLATGTVYELDNTSGALALNVVLEQSVPAGTDVFCGSSVNLAINTPPMIQVANIAEGALFTANITPQITIIDTNLKASAMTLNGNPYIQGAPVTRNNAYTLAITAEDLLGNKSSLTLHFTLSKPAVVLGTAMLGPATIGAAYTQTLAANGGTAPYSWTISAGNLPPGLVINSTTGVVSGTPTAVGLYAVTFLVTDADQSSASRSLIMSVNDIGPQWMKQSGNTQAIAAGIAVDEFGNVYVTGYSTNGTNNDYLTVKYDQAGNVLWTKMYDSGADDRATGIALDGSGNAYVTGHSGDGSANAYLTIKYDATGSVVWTQRYDNGPNSAAAGIAVDTAGNAFVTGTTCTATGCDIITRGYDPGGSVTWTQKYDNGTDDHAAGIAVDAAGNVLTAGYTANGTNIDYVTIKFNAAGNLVWIRNYDSGADDYATGIAADASGNTYVTGYSGSGNANSYLTVKYDPAGNVAWTRKYESGFNDHAAGVSLDAEGNVYVVGSSLRSNNSDYQIVKHDATGNVIWTQRYDSGANEYAAGIALDAIGSVSVTGYTRNTESATDYLTIKYRKVGQGMAITTTTLPIAVLNAFYTKTLVALGGTTPYTWSIIAGSLPDGISLNASTGELSGTVSMSAGSTFTVRVTDATGATTDQTFTLAVHDAPVITTSALSPAVMGIAYSQIISAGGGSGSYASWSVASGALPPGLSLTQNGNTGQISGTPTQTGNYSFSIRVTDTDGLFSVKQFTLAVTNVSITTSQLASGMVGFAYIQTLAAAGGTTPYTWSSSSGSLPTGLTLDSAAGVISGIPTMSGTYNVTVQVTDANAAVSVKELSITINDPLGAYQRGGSFIAAKKVLFKPREEVTIYCTTDGADPDVSPAYVCSGPILISQSLTLKFMPVDASGNRGPLKTEHYIITGGNAFAWGNNIAGQLGDGTSGTNKLTPVQVNGLSGVVATAGGASHTIALKNDGTVWAWGSNDSGQLGDGTLGTNRPTPAQVNGLTGVIAVAGGVSHSIALKNDGTVWTWGNNDSGQLGDGTLGTNRSTPVQVSGLIRVVDIASGGNHSIALRNDGTVWAWGNNDSGQLGDGAMGTNSSIPTQVSGLTGMIAVAGGASHSVALKNDGTVWAWGSNSSGQLGDGTSGTNSSIPIQVSGLTGVVAVAGGTSHSVALNNDGTVWAWGNNDSGQLGDGTSGTNRPIPVQVSGLTGVTFVAGGTSYSVALKNDGTVWTWGGNDSGQLGDGTSGANRPTPNQVDGLTSGDAIAGGNKHVLAITASALTIDTSALRNGIANALYNQSITVSGGLAPYTWSLISGSLPVGLSLNASTGVITGTPTIAGTFNFTVLVADANGTTNTKALTITITATDLTISTETLPSGTVGASYTQTLVATGGLTPYTWLISSGSLPAGLSLDVSAGTITGTPTTAGTVKFTVRVTDANSAVATKSLSIAVYNPVSITTTSLAFGTTGKAYNKTLAATGGKTPRTWSITTGSLPAGLTLKSTTGAIKGKPTTAGAYNFTVQAADSQGRTATQALSIAIYDVLRVITTTLPSGMVGALYSQALVAAGGLKPYTWSSTAGSLPPGLTLNSTTGSISGEPTARGTFRFRARVTDADAQTAVIILSIKIN